MPDAAGLAPEPAASHTGAFLARHHRHRDGDHVGRHLRSNTDTPLKVN